MTDRVALLVVAAAVAAPADRSAPRVTPALTEH